MQEVQEKITDDKSPPNSGNEFFRSVNADEMDEMIDQIGKKTPANSVVSTQKKAEINNQSIHSRRNHTTMSNSEANNSAKNNDNSQPEKTVKVSITVNEKHWSILNHVAVAQNRIDAADIVQDVVAKMGDTAYEKMSAVLGNIDFFPKTTPPGKRS